MNLQELCVEKKLNQILEEIDLLFRITKRLDIKFHIHKIKSKIRDISNDPIKFNYNQFKKYAEYYFNSTKESNVDDVDDLKNTKLFKAKSIVRHGPSAENHNSKIENYIWLCIHLSGLLKRKKADSLGYYSANLTIKELQLEVYKEGVVVVYDFSGTTFE